MKSRHWAWNRYYACSTIASKTRAARFFTTMRSSASTGGRNNFSQFANRHTTGLRRRVWRAENLPDNCLARSSANLFLQTPCISKFRWQLNIPIVHAFRLYPSVSSNILTRLAAFPYMAWICAQSKSSAKAAATSAKQSIAQA